MAILLEDPRATGAPGIPPRWTRSAKDAVVTAYSSVSRVWVTASSGALNEIYFPTIDQAQVRDVQYLVTDGETFFHDERRYLNTVTEYLKECGLGVRITNSDPDGRYRLVKEVIADPHQAVVLMHTRLEGEPAFLKKLHLYVLLAPHLAIGGWGNNGNVARIAGRDFLTAHKNGVWLGLAATAPFIHLSCGYVGTTDGWQDLSANFKLDFEFASATDGNIALTGEIDLRNGTDFTLGIAFGRSLHRAVTSLAQSLAIPFSEHRERFLDQWSRACRHFHQLEQFASDGGTLYRRSRELLLAHEDKTYAGAIIASLSIPWGESKGDEDLGGYHLVWTRDMVNSATGLLAAGDTTTAERALIYLACSQQSDGGFPQNFWIDGQPYWSGIQLDEVAFPIMLAWRLHKAGALKGFAVYPMVLHAARYLMVNGPVTPQERWEENSGYSPSTLASSIAALICAACLAREHGDLASARYLEEYADFLESHIETWTVTNHGTLVPGIRRHYIRINPIDPNEHEADEDPDKRFVMIHNRPPGTRAAFPAAEIVDGGFLELVRYGIRKPGDPLIEDSLRVVDAVLRHDYPAGPCWRRYTHDGYGQRDDGGPYLGSGRGRPWPLLTGERAHYELAAGRDPRPYIRAIEHFANPTRLLPEQIWDQPDLPRQLLFYGCQTGAAMPLMWAHAEYVKLLRSTADGRVFDLIDEVAERYQRGGRGAPIEIWKTNRRVRSVAAGTRLRIQAPEAFTLHWTKDEWQTAQDTASTSTPLGLHYVDIEVGEADQTPIRFTFHWREGDRWEGRDYVVEVSGEKGG